MKKNYKKYVFKIIEILEKDYKGIKCALDFSNPFELLIATILSAQCTEKRVNNVTGRLFEKYRNIKDYANANILELENYIKSVGFYRNKAKNIIKSAQLVMNKYNGIIPQTMEELLEFPGVARKTANVVLSIAFGKSEGIVVDTHVIRISNLLKLTEYNDPVRIEKDLIRVVPKGYWISFSFLIQTLGRSICKARNPNHSICPLNKLCPSFYKII
ncbi:MAG: endonuclease III [Endomicrobium sp.]|jgi:endonuclease-3|nr:endonuclease III [Endomicrobium sp.]